ncbi:hypothetical protein V8G54_018459, partial [Vigna mungo]
MHKRCNFYNFGGWSFVAKTATAASSAATTKSTSTATATVAATPETATAATASGGSHCLVIRECSHRGLPRQRLGGLGFWNNVVENRVLKREEYFNVWALIGLSWVYKLLLFVIIILLFF